MADLFVLDGLMFNGYPNDTEGFDIAASVSPLQVADAFDAAPGQRKYTWGENAYTIGASQAGESPMQMMERTVPLFVRNRFSSAFTNLLTNPRPGTSIGSWENYGTVSAIAIATVDGESVVSVTTNGNANTGMDHPFTATAAAHSAGCWVKVASGTAPIDVLFESKTATSITATTTWQFVESENQTLTAATRKLVIKQTDTGSRTIYAKMAGAVASATYPGYFDGACGDATWNGTAHASTSTAKTGEDAILHVFGELGTKGEKCNAKASQGGITLYWQAAGATYRSSIDCRAVDVTKLDYDHKHAVADGSGRRIAACEVTMICHPHAKGPQYTAGTFYKASGVPALEVQINDVKGHVRGPAEINITGGTVSNQKFAIYGAQGRDTVTTAPLVIRGPSMGTAGYSGSIVAHVNEVQTISQVGIITAGSYALSLDAVAATAANIVYTSGTAALDTYIETIPNIGTGGVTVSAGPLPGTAGTITFGGTLAGCNVSPLVVNNAGLTGGSYAIATNTTGVPGYVTAGLYTEPTVICDTGNLSLVGSYDVWARVYDNAATSDLYKSRVRLRWNVGDGGFTTNKWATPQAVGDYSLVNLGQVHIGTAASGTQRSKGLVEAKTSGTAGNTLRVVDLYFFPMETGLGEVRAVDSGSSTLSMFDNFSAISGAITGDTSSSGHTWATMGGVTDADDFSKGTGNTVVRTAVSDTSPDIRYGRGVILGTATPTDVAASVDVVATVFGKAYQGVILRFVDNDNFAAAILIAGGAGGGLHLWKVVGGAATMVGRSSSPTVMATTANVKYNVGGAISAQGSWSIYLNGTKEVSGVDSVFATGGTLANGKTGLIDWQSLVTVNTRTYSNFTVSIPAAEEYALYTSQDLAFRSNEILRENSAGGVYGAPFQNSQPMQPELTPEGAEGITNRLLLRTARNNPDVASDPLADAFTATILHTPVYLLGRDEN